MMEFKEKDVSFIWGVINDFWSVFEDAHIVAQLWRGYSNVVDNLYYQLYQINLSKCVHTIQPDWISDWELFKFDESTELPGTRATLTLGFTSDYLGEADIDFQLDFENNTQVIHARSVVSDVVNGRYSAQFYHQGSHDNEPPSYLPGDTAVEYSRVKGAPVVTSSFCYGYRLPENIKNVFRLRESPREIIYLPANTILDAAGKIYLPDRTVRLPGDNVYLPENEDDMVYDIAYTNLGEPYVENILFPKGLAVNCVQYTRGVDFIVDEPNRAIFFNRQPYPTLWGNVAFRRMTAIYDNFGCLIDHPGWDSREYLMEVQGLWFAYWNGATLSNIESGLTILLNAPFAYEDGLITDINLATRKIMLSTTEYSYPEGHSPSVAVGDFVRKFKPLTGAVRVFDRLNFPNWWMTLIGYAESSQHQCNLDNNTALDNGTLDFGILDDSFSEHCMNAAFIEVHTFLVKVDYRSWFRTAASVKTAKTFLDAIKPSYTHYILQTAFPFVDQYPEITDTYFNATPLYRFSDPVCDHNGLDEEWLHPTLDDGSQLDFTNERDNLRVSTRTYEWATLDDEDHPELDSIELDHAESELYEQVFDSALLDRYTRIRLP